MQKGVHNEDQKSLESSIRNKQLTFKNNDNITSKVEVIFWYNFSARKFWEYLSRALKSSYPLIQLF